MFPAKLGIKLPKWGDLSDSFLGGLSWRKFLCLKVMKFLIEIIVVRCITLRDTPIGAASGSFI